MKRLRLYSRPACDLCEELEQALYENFDGHFTLDWRDVDRDPRMQARFGPRIPVLTTSEDSVLCETRLDLQAVQAYLTAP